jgi:hypothetical protein
VEVSALVRQVNAQGGFAMVLAKGEPDAGTILLLLCENGQDQRIYERMPMADGTRGWHCAKRLDPNDPGFSTHGWNAAGPRIATFGSWNWTSRARNVSSDYRFPLID